MRRESWMLPRAVNIGRKVELKFADKRTLTSKLLREKSSLVVRT